MRSPLLLAVVLAACTAACASAAPPRPQPTAQPVPSPDRVERLPAGPVPPPRDDGRLPSLARPIRYALDLVVDPSQPGFEGTATFDLELPEPTAHVVLHARDLTILDAHLEQRGATFPATTAARPARRPRRPTMPCPPRPRPPRRPPSCPAPTTTRGTEIPRRSLLARMVDLILGSDRGASSMRLTVAKRRGYRDASSMRHNGPTLRSPGPVEPDPVKSSLPRGRIELASR